jgi:hypothetical protein
MNSASDQALTDSVVTTFADMAFIDVAILPEPPADFDISHVISVSFTDPVAGNLALYLPYECKRQIVENIYGEDWQNLSSTEIDDCLLEILNVLAGNFLNNCYAPGERVSMSFPELLFDDHRIHDLDKKKEFYYDAEGQPFKLALIL